MVYVGHLKCPGRKAMRVRLPPSAPFFLDMKEKYAIKRSGIAGLGVFSIAPISQGETVRTFTGTSYDLLGMLRLVDSGDEAGSDPLGVDHNEYLDLDEVSRTFNHSCQLNCYL